LPTAHAAGRTSVVPSGILLAMTVEIIILQGRYLHTEVHKHNKHTDIHAFSGIGTHDSSVEAGEDCSCLGRRGHCGRRLLNIRIVMKFILNIIMINNAINQCNQIDLQINQKALLF
jgi:hypothetical protein